MRVLRPTWSPWECGAVPFLTSRDARWSSHFGRQHGSFLQKTLSRPSGLAAVLFGIYLVNRKLYLYWNLYMHDYLWQRDWYHVMMVPEKDRLMLEPRVSSVCSENLFLLISFGTVSPNQIFSVFIEIVHPSWYGKGMRNLPYQERFCCFWPPLTPEQHTQS